MSLWRSFYDVEPTGVFNTILGWVGLGPVPWLEDPSWAMPSLVIEATWAAAGGTVLIYLAALVSVPPELYDAAETGKRIEELVRADAGLGAPGAQDDQAKDDATDPLVETDTHAHGG